MSIQTSPKSCTGAGERRVHPEAGTPLEVATRYYYWKPAVALFRALELKLYSEIEFPLEKPVLDLGCGDGNVAAMLRELQVIEKALCGLDISRTQLRKAKAADAHLNLSQVDANCLPFRNESFSTIICNGVLCSIPEGPELAVKEIARVLKTRGILIATVPTNQFMEVLLIPKILRKVSDGLGSYYVKRKNSRLPHFNAYARNIWIENLATHGLKATTCRPFFSSRVGYVWNMIGVQVLRVIGLLRLIRIEVVRKAAGKMLNKMFMNIYLEEPRGEAECGYLFIVAQKS